LLYDPDVMDVHHRPGDSPNAPSFDQTVGIDRDVDALSDPVVWSKPPFECWVTPKRGNPFMLIGVHAKSKAAHGAKTDADAMRINIANRRKQLAQCIWLRRRVDTLLDAQTPTIVLGDFNDGPGLDDYEKLFGRSGVEIVLGDADEHALFDPNAHMALTNRFAKPTTARFWISSQKRFLSALLDYVMVSNALRPQADWHIWHPFDDAVIYENMALRDALLTASDHFPVSVDLPSG
ncbi:MAG: endonuclease/exonuclease/phosphatase family protein, partial [Pseudomonadota bacterium]